MNVMEANETLERVVGWQLPAFNTAYLAGALSLEEQVDLIDFAVTGLISAIDEHGLAGLDVDQRERVMTTVGFVIGSVEHHARSERRPVNTGIGLFPGLERMLVVLAGADLPVRDTARTFWLVNSEVHGDRLLTYTHDRGERFNRQVREVDSALGEANELLRSIIAAGGPLSPGDTERLAHLPELVRRYKAAYTEFRHRDSDGLPITPEFFTFVFRTFLPEIVVSDEVWNGPNAAWLANVFSFDSLFGTATSWYRHYNLGKVKYLTAAEADTVTTDLAGLSVMDILAATVRTPAGLGSVSDIDLAARLERAGAYVIAAARAVRDTWLELNKGTNGHAALVRDFLDKPSAGLDDDAVANMAVNPHVGTGGGSRELLGDIGEMRKRCISGKALVAALRLLDDNPPDAMVTAVAA